MEAFKNFLAKYGIWLLFLIFILATFNFLYKESFDNQEIDYLKISQWNVRKIIFENWGDQLPFWFILAKTYIGVFGKSELSLKTLSVATFLLSAFILYKICEIWGLNKYLVSALFLFNPLLLEEIAFTFKHWSFLILMVLLTLYLFEKFKNSRNGKYLFFLFAAIAAGMYSNLIFLIFFCSFAVYMLTNLLSGQISRRFFLFFIIISVVSGLPLFYYYEKASRQLFDIQGANMGWGTAARGFDFIKTSLAAASGANYLNGGLSAVLVFLIFLFFILQFFLERKKEFANLKIWLVSAVFFILLVLMIMAASTPVSSRYYAAAVPLLYLAIFPKSNKKYVLAIAVLILSMTVFSSWQMVKSYNPDNWKGISSFLQPKIKENTQILIIYKFNVGNLLMEYHLKKPVTRLPDLENDLVLYSDDIWIIAHSGSYGAIQKASDDYGIKEYDDFKPTKLFHLTKKNPEKKNGLIFSDPLIEIKKKKEMRKVPFSNGASSAWNSLEDWRQIRISAIKSGGVEKICLFAHPRNNEKINLAYKDIVLGQTLKITTGISDNMIDKNLSPVYMDVYDDNVLLKKITHPNKWGWMMTEINTSLNKKKPSDIKFTIYADNDEKRHFCFDAEISEPNDYFYRNIRNAEAAVGNNPCQIYKTEPIFPHNEKQPPFAEAAIFERWDCGENLILKNKIWDTVGKSYAVSDNEFREAIWFHPQTNKIKTLEYKDINLEVKKITGFYGLNDLSIANKINPTLTFAITANGEKIYEDKFVPTKGWKKFEIPFNPVRNSTEIQTSQSSDNKISNGVNNKLENAVFSITTDNDRWNHFFFNAFLEEK